MSKLKSKSKSKSTSFEPNHGSTSLLKTWLKTNPQALSVSTKLFEQSSSQFLVGSTIKPSISTTSKPSESLGQLDKTSFESIDVVDGPTTGQSFKSGQPFVTSSQPLVESAIKYSSFNVVDHPATSQWSAKFNNSSTKSLISSASINLVDCLSSGQSSGLAQSATLFGTSAKLLGQISAKSSIKSLTSSTSINLVDDLTFRIVNVDAPHWYINPDLRELFKDRSNYDIIADCSPLSLAPNLGSILAANKPPTIAFFKSLPSPSSQTWGIYALLFEKAGCQPLLYIGSGTSSLNGVASRLHYYKPGASNLPRFVKQAFEDNYHISHRGVLCWSPTPTIGLVPRVRARFLALEAMFTIMFHACIAAITDMYLRHLYIWRRDTVEWKPLCSHLSLKEAIRGGFTLSKEELEAVAAIRAARATELGNINSRKHRAKRRAADPEAYILKVRIDKRKWSENNQDKVNKTAAKSQNKSRELRRFYCDTCEIALQSDSALKKHILTSSHADRLAGVMKSAPSNGVIAYAAVRDAAKANKTHYCSPCDKAFGNDYNLRRHKATPSHAKRVERLKS